VLGPLRSRDYRLFWTGSLIANLGVWIQTTALGWLVYTMTQRASLLGTVQFAGNLPILVLGLVGGAVADRASRRAIMLSSLSVIAATALALAVLTATGHIAVWQIIAITMVAGAANALFAPATQAVIPSIVEQGDLLNAISLNSVQFNVARTIGPALAGLAYGVIGAGGCFTANAVGMVVMVVMIARVRMPRRKSLAAPPPVLRALRDALRYARTEPVIATGLLLAGVMSLFGFPYIIMLPAVARDTLGLDSSGYGYLLGSVGAGAVAGGLGLVAVRDPARKDLLAAWTAVAFGLTLASFGVVRSAHAFRLVLFTMGVLQTICVASINTTIQLVVHDGMRGRVMSMMTVILFGVTNAGAVPMGLVGDRIGVPNALACGGVVVAIVALGVLGRALAPAPAVPRVES
jgi:MFS family permease